MVTQAATWGNFNFLDRHSVLVLEDGSRDSIDPELTAALLTTIDARPNKRGHRRNAEDQALGPFLREVLSDLGIGSMEDIGEATLAELLEGTLSD